MGLFQQLRFSGLLRMMRATPASSSRSRMSSGQLLISTHCDMRIRPVLSCPVRLRAWPRLQRSSLPEGVEGLDADRASRVAVTRPWSPPDLLRATISGGVGPAQVLKR
jgi:hypothetical protein